MISLREIIETRNAELAAKYESGDPIVSCVQTGLVTLDNAYVNERGILTTYQAHSGEGKSSAARVFLEGAASAGFEPIFMPFEDPPDKISDAFTSSCMGVTGGDLRNGKVKDAPKRLLAATDSLWWSENVQVQPDKIPTEDIIRLLNSEITERTGLVVLDYYQAMDAEQDEKSVERVISRLCWKLLDVAKTYNVAVIGFSQVKNDVITRGKQSFDRIAYTYQRNNEEMKPEAWMVEGFRPVYGDSQWATGIYQRSKDLMSIFRPGRWLQLMGFTDAKDDYSEWMRVKANYNEGQKPLKIGWNGPTSSFHEWRKK